MNQSLKWPPQFGTFKQAQRVHQAEALQGEPVIYGMNWRKPLDRLAVRQAIKFLDEDIAQKREQARQNAACFYQGCTEPPIKSHIISKKLLRHIAKKNKVLNLPTSESRPFSDIIDAIDAGTSLEFLNIEPVLIDIGDVQLTDPLFCQPHDTSVFAQIDNREIAEHAERIPKQVLLLAYRALCSLTYQLSNHQSTIDTILEFSKKVGYKHSLAEPERYARLHRFLANDPMLAVYKRHEQIRKSRDYSQLGYGLYVVNVPPCIATTYSLIPVDDEDAKAIMNGTLRVGAEDAVSFSFLPHEPLNSICVISWLKDSQRAKRFVTLNRINDLSESEQQDLFFHFAFESRNVYVSPDWWNSLSGEQRVKYTMIHINSGREHAALV